MPIFMDRHDMRGATAENVAEAHRKDLEIQDKYGVKYMTYCYDAERCTGARNQLWLRGDDVRMRFDDNVGDRLVVLAPLAAQQRLVGRVLDQGMAEEEDLVRHPH
jgi:hypothetical protein